MASAIWSAPLDRPLGRDGRGGPEARGGVLNGGVADRDAAAGRLESLGRLTVGVAHDFNNLITILLGYADLLEGHVQDDGRELLDALSGAASQAGRLAQQLLSLSRHQPAGAGPLDLSGLVHELAGLLRRVFNKQISLVVQAPSGLRVWG